MFLTDYHSLFLHFFTCLLGEMGLESITSLAAGTMLFAGCVSY